MAIVHFRGSGIIVPAGVKLSTQAAVMEDRMVSASLAKEIEVRDIPGIVDGSDIIQTVDSYTRRTTWTFTTSTESVDWSLMELLFNEASQETASFSEGHDYFRATVPATPFEITNTKILSTFTASDIQVSIVENGAWGKIRPLTVVTTGTPTADQVLLTAATSKLTFHEDNEGATIKVAPKKTLTTVDTIGVEDNPKSFDGSKFTGILTSTRGEEYLTVIDGLTQSEGWTLTMGDESAQDLTWRATTTGSSRSPVKMARIVTAA